MQAVLQLFFDETTDIFFRSLWQKIKDAGLPNPLLQKVATPHITLSFGSDVNITTLVPELSTTLSSTPSVPLTFASLSTFANKNGVIFIAPVVTTVLLTLHEKTHLQMSNHTASTSVYSQVGRWFPHVTLTMRLNTDELLKAFEVLRDLQLPFEGQGKKVCLLEFPSLRELAAWELSSNP